VPRINEHTAGLEHYRAFCKGRSLAFEAAFGAGFEQQLPAASAVGSDGGTIEVVFAAGEKEPQHVENPEQVPAYLYPAEHGPRSPSFSRATVVEEGDRRWVFISGTAAIKGHTTVGVGSLREQIACTLDNLRLISSASGVGENLGAARSGTGEREETVKWTRYFKVYLRRESNLAEAKGLLDGKLFFAGDHVTWLRSDICRAELDIEIEATLLRKI
jgi:chorismate lyase / 3-hydroxybenzoate synthase